MKRNIVKTTLLLAAFGTLAALPVVGQPTQPCLTPPFNIGTCPGWVDVNGNGKWDPGVDKLITFGFSVGTAQLTIINPWSTACGEPGGHTVQFGSPTGCGFTTASTMTNPNEGTQMVTATGFTGGLPNAFSYVGSGIPGTGALMPSSGPPYSGIQLTGGALNMLVGPFQGVDASGEGGPLNHITIPWAQASMLGMNGACGKIAFPGGDPQIFLPVVPGAPGTGQLVPSFPGMCSSPVLLMAVFEGRASIPTLSEWGLILLLVGLGLAGWELLRRSGALA